MAKRFSGNRTGQVRMLYNPYQQEFRRVLALRHANGTRAFNRFALIAGRRGGKTFVGAVGVGEELARPTWHGEPARWWAVAPTYEELHDYVIPTVFSVIPDPWIADWSELHKDLRLKNGALLQFRSGEDPERMRGPGLDGLWFDEARKIRKLCWDTARPMLTERRGAGLFTTSPAGFDWVYRTFWQKALPGPNQHPGFWATKYRTIDNPAIPVEEIEEARATMDPLFFAQEYEAEFVSFEGAIYGTAIEPCILHTDAEIKRYLPDWPRIPETLVTLVGLDMGTDHPFAAVKLVVTEHGLICVGEYRRRAASFAEHAAGVKALVGPILANQDVRFALDRTAFQAQIELAQHGILAGGAENSVTAGIQRVQSWLRTKQLVLIESACPLLIEEMRSYHWRPAEDRKGERKPEAPFKFDDDLCDALRYAVMLWPELPRVIMPNQGRSVLTVPMADRWAWERMQVINKREAGNGEGEEDGLDWGSELTPVGDMFM